MNVKVEKILKKSPTFHDFPYSGNDRKCPHLWIINVTPPGAPHCIHKCPFCYARWSIYGDRRWNAPLKVYSNLPELIEKEIRNMDIIPPVSISNITDPAQNVPELRKEVNRLLSFLFDKGFTVLFCTKGDASFAVKLAAEKGHERFVLQVSIEGPDEVLRLTSPGAISFEKRLKLVKLASSAGIFVIVRIDPFFLHLWQGLYGAEWKKKISEFMDKISEAGASHIIASTGRFSGRTFVVEDMTEKKNDFVEYLQLCKKLGISSESCRKDFVRGKTCGVLGVWLKRELADEVHQLLYKLASERKMTYAICQDLSTLKIDDNLPSCYGTQLPFTLNINGKLLPIKGCSGNCLKCTSPHPECQHLQGLKRPLKKTDLKLSHSLYLPGISTPSMRAG